MASKKNSKSGSTGTISKLNIITDVSASETRSIADAIVVKDNNILMLSKPDGRVPTDPGHGYGLYFNDCRYLNAYDLKIGGRHAETLVAAETLRYEATYQLTNPTLQLDDGRVIQKQCLGIQWKRLVDSEKSVLYDLLSLKNYSHEPVEVPLTFYFDARFEDIFTVRGQVEEIAGELHDPVWNEDSTLSFSYDGADGIYRNLLIHFSESPRCHPDHRTVEYQIRLKPQEEQQIRISLDIRESQDRENVPAKAYSEKDYRQARERLADSYEQWRKNHTEIETDSRLLNTVIRQSSRDLRVLRSTLHGNTYFAAGTPWFATLFGRDSLITAYQTLIYDPQIAENTLRILAQYQGREQNRRRDEQPGKMLHEYRINEFTRMGELPYDPYYGSIDATPLFLILMGEHALWTGRLDLFHELHENVERALNWMKECGDENRDGYVEYRCHSDRGIYNQGWKDSADGIVTEDGGKADPPIALVEVQGYVYDAKRKIAKLYRLDGDEARARQLEDEAQQLKEAFNRDYWLDDKDFYALAIHGEDNRLARVISSNPGHTLWSGIADEDKAKKTVRRLMADDMFCGWGIRTLSSQEAGYNPQGYHLGSVWPHDNAIIAAGFRKYGFDEEACRVFNGLLAATMYFKDFQLPEVFSGFGRDIYDEPAYYPVADHPQAWAAGSIPLFMTMLLGLRPNAFENELQIVHPILPEPINTLHVRRLKVGGARVDLAFKRTDEGVSATVLDQTGELNVVIR